MLPHRLLSLIGLGTALTVLPHRASKHAGGRQPLEPKKVREWKAARRAMAKASRRRNRRR